MKSPNTKAKEAVKWLSSVVSEMEMELHYLHKFFKMNKIEPESLQIPKASLNYMTDLYQDLHKSLQHYKKTENDSELNQLCWKMEVVEPGFQLNYNLIKSRAQKAGYKFPD